MATPTSGGIVPGTSTTNGAFVLKSDCTEPKPKPKSQRNRDWRTQLRRTSATYGALGALGRQYSQLVVNVRKLGLKVTVEKHEGGVMFVVRDNSNSRALNAFVKGLEHLPQQPGNVQNAALAEIHARPWSPAHQSMILKLAHLEQAREKRAKPSGKVRPEPSGKFHTVLVGGGSSSIIPHDGSIPISDWDIVDNMDGDNNDYDE